jgi:hypothetical protein
LDLSPALWLDASDAATITASGSPAKVSQWDDKSGNGRNVAQGTGAAQPTTGSDTINSLNVLTFDGGDTMEVTAGLNVGNVTIFVVAEETSTVNNAGLVTLGATGVNDFNNQSSLVTEFTPSPNAFGVARFSTAAPNGLSSVSGSKPSPLGVYVGRFTGNGEVQALSNSATGTATTRAGTFTNCTSVIIAGRYGVAAAAKLNGKIAEVIVYTESLSNSSLNVVGGYLSTKWGLTWTDK